METLLIGLGLAAVVLLLLYVFLYLDRFPALERTVRFFHLVLMRGVWVLLGLLIILVALAIGGAAIAWGVDSKNAIGVAFGALVILFGAAFGGTLTWEMWKDVG